jgi:hypothetical protein
MQLGRQTGIPINKAWFTETGFKSREQGNMLKEKLIAYLCKIVSEENLPDDNMPNN